MDIYSGDQSTAGVIPIGTSLTSEIDTVGDKDWFAVDLQAGSRYRFTLTTEALSDLGTLDYFAIEGLIDPDGRNLNYGRQADTPFDDAAVLEHLTLESGRYYLPLRGAPDWTQTQYPQKIGGYRITVEEITDTDDHGSSVATATPIVLGQTVTGRIDNTTNRDDDRDWFALTLEAGQVFQPDLSFVGEDLTGFGRVYSQVNTPQIYFQNARTDALTRTDGRIAEADGTYYIDLGGYYGVDYTLSVTSPWAYAPEQIAQFSRTGFPQTRSLDDVGLENYSYANFGGAKHIFHRFGAGDEIIEGDARASFIGGGGRDLMLGGDGIDLLIGDTGFSGAQLQASFQISMLYELLLGRDIDAATQERIDTEFTNMQPNFFVNYVVDDWARRIIQSDEFAEHYGPLDPDDTQERSDFIEFLYGGLRGKAPGSIELRDWVNFSQYLSEAGQIALRFAASPEAFDRFAADKMPGLLTPVDAADFGLLYAAYDTLLGRTPDATGIAGWGARLADGVGLEAVIDGILNGREYARRTTGQNDAEIAEGTARSVLDALTAPDARTLHDFMRDTVPDDVLIAKGGNDLLWGGILSDTFVFTPGEGFNRVLDFEVWDTLDLRAFDFSDAEAALAAFTAQDGKAVFNRAGTVIVLYGTDPATLTEDALLI